MERRKFLQTGLLGTVLAAFFPRLIRASESDLTNTDTLPEAEYSYRTRREIMADRIKDYKEYHQQYPLTPYEAYMPGGDIEFRLDGIFHEIDINISGRSNTTKMLKGGYWHTIWNGNNIKLPHYATNLIIPVETQQLMAYDTIRLKYRYHPDGFWVNLFIPVTRLLRDRKFFWDAVRPIKWDSEGMLVWEWTRIEDGMVMHSPNWWPNERPGIVIESNTDEINVWLST